uniref:3-isopropylmalate dehydrogenase n=1 Tax=Melanopsichium pennsylvanicum 4 TaxID=1398559 RepID=A0A077R9V8_9BASI|nr:3-isopropylmalate dehydrogenase [Melanopsichium pennsylvanicum 4]
MLTIPRFVIFRQLFEDILNNLTSVIAGSLGLLGSAEIDATASPSADDRLPMGGQQPILQGKGSANPIGMFESFGLMVETFVLSSNHLIVVRCLCM